MKKRRYDIDWLRVVAMLAVFLYHCARFFNMFDWHLKNAEQSIIVTLFTGVLDMWMMQLFFLLAGVGSWYALKSRSGGQYLFERVKRLLIPLYTVGAFILLPPQFYFELVTHREYAGTLWKLIPPLYGGSLRFSLDAPYLINLWLGHLWFLQFLFLISLLILPLLLYLRSESGQRLIERLAGWCDRRGGIFLFLIPLALIRLGFTGFFRGEHTWADLFYFAVFFLIGYIMPADERFTVGFKRHGWVCLALGIAGYGGVVVSVLRLGYDPMVGESFSWTYVLFQIAWSIANWGWVVFILSLGAKYLNFSNKVLTYGNEAVLPFYIFHQTIILVVGWFVIRWNMGILPKFLIISVVSFVLIMALYELFVRHFNVVRFFFGMRPKKRVRQT